MHIRHDGISCQIDPPECLAILENDEAWFLDLSAENDFSDFGDFVIADNNKTTITVTYEPEGCDKGLVAAVNDTGDSFHRQTIITRSDRSLSMQGLDTRISKVWTFCTDYCRYDLFFRSIQVKLNGKMIVKGLEEGILGNVEN